MGPLVSGDCSEVSRGSHLGHGILGDRSAMEGEFEERRDDAAPVVVGLHSRATFLQESDDGGQGKLGHGALGKVLVEAFQIPTDAGELRGGELPLLVLMGLRKLVILDRGRKRLEVFRLTVIGEGVVEIERKRAGLSGDAAECGLGFVELIISQPRGGGANAGLGLEALDFQGLTLGGALGADREILTDARTIEPADDAKNDLLGGIREF